MDQEDVKIKMKTILLAIVLKLYHPHQHWRSLKDWMQTSASIYSIPSNRKLTVAYIAWCYYECRYTVKEDK